MMPLTAMGFSPAFFYAHYQLMLWIRIGLFWNCFGVVMDCRRMFCLNFIIVKNHRPIL